MNGSNAWLLLVVVGEFSLGECSKTTPPRIIVDDDLHLSLLFTNPSLLIPKKY